MRYKARQVAGNGSVVFAYTQAAGRAVYNPRTDDRPEAVYIGRRAEQLAYVSFCTIFAGGGQFFFMVAERADIGPLARIEGFQHIVAVGGFAAGS